MKRAIRGYSGTKSSEVSPRETQNREVALKAAEEGIVLLKNDGTLPLFAGEKVALFGVGAAHTIKGGTGSGDVNEREVVSIYQGFLNAGVSLVNKEWLDESVQIYEDSRIAWRDQILQLMEEEPEHNLFNVYSSNVYTMPEGKEIRESDIADAGITFYVISRTAGEAADRFNEEGDYYLTKREIRDLKFLSDHSEKVVVILNTGGQIDVKEILALPNLGALLSVSQPGMEGGNALAKAVTGEITPSGKLTDTWAINYEDFPNAETFSHMNGDVTNELYEEGIFVGYRYFDSFEKPVEFPFGYGLSYTSFEIKTKTIAFAENQGSITVQVKNTGNRLSGKEVVQIYISCPQKHIQKEYRRLVGFAKTDLLHPGETTELKIHFPAKSLAYFDERESAWMVEKGRYGVWIGNSLSNLSLEGVLEAEENFVLEKVQHICPLQKELEELQVPSELMESRKAEEEQWIVEHQLPITQIVIQEEYAKHYVNQKYHDLAEELTEKLTEEQLISMVVGEVNASQSNALGAAGIKVPGAAGETSSILEKDYDVPGVAMADGPAGVRIMKSYQVDKTTGHIHSQGIRGAIEGGLFAVPMEYENTDTYYQYCTAIPVGTLLAQTWNIGLLEEVGIAVAKELEEFGISWWLAPGMSLHRNPLCGRNFEYYSEDPMLSGTMAAAITRGVQSVPGVGTTIKHFACNNQEDNRMGSNSVLSERALREIYLRSFEIAVKTSQPMAIMTSYNLINGVHAANNKDLCTTVVREEWGFSGIIMTDWTTTEKRGGSTAWKCAEAGNDLIMPGTLGDMENIRQALSEGELNVEDLKSCVVRLLTIIFQTLGYEDPASYNRQFNV
ncbi:MAG: glycoside hydrolase family 3 C-terminal domain-containing protein [Blautia sp.]|nr:glycoside hydrolase family 3 C-terminal domain-containing protein [Blautia sp.]